MEDRHTPTVYLELVDVERDDYLARRAPIVQHAGAERLTCWENLVRDRADLPRRLDEFGWLAVYEAGSDFRPPPPPDGIRGLHFVRTSRPAQGHLTDAETVGLLLVLISPRHDEQAGALRAWGDFVHLRHIAEASVPGYTMITPYESADGSTPRFMHLYEMETPDAEHAFQRMTPMVAEALGGYESERFQAWAGHHALRIDYVSTFRRVGSARTLAP